MKNKVVVLFTMILGTVIGLVGCGPKLIDCPDIPDRATTKVGRTKDGMLYELGVVSVRYDASVRQETYLTDGVPSAAVREYFVKRGYTPKVEGYVIDYEVISFGSDVDAYPMLKELKNVQGVVETDLHVYHKTAELLYASTLDYIIEEGWNRDRPSVGRAIVEVGRREDGSLYEFGVVLIQYDEIRTTSPNPVEAVNIFFLRKGYTPKIIDSFSNFVVIDVAECVDTAPMLGDIEAIPSVISARLNLLYPTLEVLRGGRDIPGVPSF